MDVMSARYQKTAMNPEWLTTSQVATEIGGITANQVTKWCGARLFPGSYKLPGKSGWRIPRKALDNFIAKRARA
jgi:hypothetical protein